MKTWNVVIETRQEVMPDELMRLLEDTLKGIEIVEITTRAKSVPDEFTASKMAPTRG